MIPLKNPRHEIFAQQFAQGKTADEAYALAGFKPNRGNASVMSRKPEIVARVEQLKAIAAERAITAIGVTKEKITAELAKLGFSNILDYVTIGADGLPFVDMTAVDRDKGAAIQEVIVEESMRHETGEDGKREAVPVRKVRFKLADKRAALVDMARHLGMNNDTVQIKSDADAAKTAAQLKAEILADMAELGLVPQVPVGIANKPNGKAMKH